MTPPSTDLRHTILTALCAQLLRRVKGAESYAPSEPVRPDAPHDPDWAVREIVDDAIFETAR